MDAGHHPVSIYRGRSRDLGPALDSGTGHDQGQGPIYEFGCHEGNYGLANTLQRSPRRRGQKPPKRPASNGQVQRPIVPCLLLIVVLGFPRVALVLMWLFSTYLQRAFHGGLLLPLLGFIFLPLTTIVYAWELNSGMPTAGINLLWLLIAVIIDLGGLGGGAHRQSRSKIRRFAGPETAACYTCPVPLPLILASQSPRRRDLLATAGIPFTVRAREVEEIRAPGEPPEALRPPSGPR